MFSFLLNELNNRMFLVVYLFFSVPAVGTLDTEIKYVSTQRKPVFAPSHFPLSQIGTESNLARHQNVFTPNWTLSPACPLATPGSVDTH